MGIYKISQNNVALGCKMLITVCANLKQDESILIVTDKTTCNIGELLVTEALKITSHVLHRTIAPFTMHGQEPPQAVAKEMADSHVIVGLTKMSMAHSQARLNACLAGARYLSLPDYTLEVLARPALHTDFREFSDISNTLALLLTSGQTITLTTQNGTHLICDIAGRQGNAAPGWCWASGTLASPPDVEANVALNENGSNGVVVVDGSIPCEELGLIDDPLTLSVKNGRVYDVQGRQSGILNSVLDHSGEDANRVVAEFGLGLNPNAQLRGSMLEDEGCLGTVHLGLGSNSTIGGKNKVPFHLDCVVRAATVKIDNITVFKNGHLLEEIAS